AMPASLAFTSRKMALAFRAFQRLARKETLEVMRSFFVMMIAAVSLWGGVSATRAEDQPDAATLKLGQRVFLLCRSCHTTGEKEGPKVGPNLWHVFGRKSGSKPDFRYSDAVKNANIVWSEKTIDQWLSNPRDFLPGNKMAFRGLDKAEDRKAVIAYLK